MVDRVWFVGSNAGTGPQIEAGFLEMLALLDNHLASRPYLFGGRPAFGDFGLWGQIYQMWKDPTAGALIEGGAPHVLDWVHRMLWPKAEGAFEGCVLAKLMPILSCKQIRRNSCQDLRQREKRWPTVEEFSVALGDKIWTEADSTRGWHIRAGTPPGLGRSILC
jgi:hypothetical protein